MKCQKDPTCGIFLKRGFFKDIKNYIQGRVFPVSGFFLKTISGDIPEKKTFCSSHHHCSYHKSMHSLSEKISTQAAKSQFLPWFTTKSLQGKSLRFEAFIPS